MFIYSAERSTGMGAWHCTEVMFDDEWQPVSYQDDAEYMGRVNGFEIYRTQRIPGDKIRAYHRSNSGGEYFEAGRMCRGYSRHDKVI